MDITVLEDRYAMWLEGAYLRPDHRSIYYRFSEKEQEAQDKIVKEERFEPLDPILNFTDDETSKIAELQTSLQNQPKNSTPNIFLTPATEMPSGRISEIRSAKAVWRN